MQERHVGDDDAVAARVTAVAVTPRARDDPDAVRATPAHRPLHVGGVRAIRDRARPQVVEAGVPEPERSRVARSSLCDDVAIELVRERLDGTVGRGAQRRGGGEPEEAAAVHRLTRPLRPRRRGNSRMRSSQAVARRRAGGSPPPRPAPAPPLRVATHRREPFTVFDEGASSRGTGSSRSPGRSGSDSAKSDDASSPRATARRALRSVAGRAGNTGVMWPRGTSPASASELLERFAHVAEDGRGGGCGVSRRLGEVSPGRACRACTQGILCARERVRGLALAEQDGGLLGLATPIRACTSLSHPSSSDSEDSQQELFARDLDLTASESKLRQRARTR